MNSKMLYLILIVLYRGVIFIYDDYFPLRSVIIVISLKFYLMHNNYGNCLLGILRL